MEVRTSMSVGVNSRTDRDPHTGRWILDVWERASRSLLYLVAAAVLIFLLGPLLVVVPMSFSDSSTLGFPPSGFSLRWYENFFSDASWLSALRNSLGLALASSTLALVLGSTAAYGLVRGTFRGRIHIQANFLAPMVIPPVISAVGLYITFAKIGLLGTFPGLILAHTTVVIPFVVLLMSIGIESTDIRIEQVALTLGASRPYMLRRVLLPNLVPTALVAWVFAFMVSFDEIVVTLFLAGGHDTVPKKMFLDLKSGMDPTITAIASLLIFASIITATVMLVVVRRLSKLTLDEVFE